MSKETQNIEWKESWHNDYFKWICSFANAQGGTLFIGKDDNGNVKHLANAKNFWKIFLIK
jgi:ATP-dependent DNA helicase RecG